jgi:hypothetical protein
VANSISNVSRLLQRASSTRKSPMKFQSHAIYALRQHKFAVRVLSILFPANHPKSTTSSQNSHSQIPIVRTKPSFSPLNYVTRSINRCEQGKKFPRRSSCFANNSGSFPRTYVIVDLFLVPLDKNGKPPLMFSKQKKMFA